LSIIDAGVRRFQIAMEDITSKRTETNKVKLSFFAEDMLRHILGNYYTNWHGYELTEREWKHILSKLVAKMEIAIEVNLLTDNIHYKRINFQLDCMKGCLSEKGNADPEHVIALIGLCFELLGGLPDNRRRKHANKKNYFDLSAKRSVHFIQSLRQKARVILQSAWYEPFKDFYSHGDIHDKYYLDFGCRSQEFIDWYKTEFPQLYAKLF
jgi:hypothetical protein